jgi:putative hydrolase of HD superfamily
VPEAAEVIAALGYERGLLERIRRTGWWHAGVRDPESAAAWLVEIAGAHARSEMAVCAPASVTAPTHPGHEPSTSDLGRDRQ